MKSYFAETVQLAVEQARRELGPDAALVTSRVTSADARHLGEYEVVFVTDLPERAETPATPPFASQKGKSSVLPDEFTAELGRIRQEFHDWRAMAWQWMAQPRWMLGEPALQEAYFQLLRADVDAEFAQTLVAKARKAAGSKTRKASDSSAFAIREALAQEVRRCCEVDPALGLDGVTPGLVALVGPPGAGKTATVAKLAIQYGLAKRRPIALISYDPARLAAAEELRWYASVIGVAFQAVETSEALCHAIEQRRAKSLLLIDTPGLTAGDLAAGREEAEYLARRDDIQKHLVLPLTMRAADLARIARAFDLLRPTRLIATHLDESSICGAVLCESVRSGSPMSFFATGQNVPEDLEPANQDYFVEQLLPTGYQQARKALSAA